uniref:Glycosyltransferase 2-like domain-containing protein n=1 Tax=Sphenodon punctatus TaxID=8508 RepID=A0A8D0GQB0_SPHPU
MSSKNCLSLHSRVFVALHFPRFLPPFYYVLPCLSLCLLLPKLSLPPYSWNSLSENTCSGSSLTIFKNLPLPSSLTPYPQRLLLLFLFCRLVPKNQCECVQESKLDVYQLKDSIDKNDLASITVRREKEFQHYLRRHPSMNKEVVIAQPNLPLSYPVHGVQVMSLHTVMIPGKPCSYEHQQPSAPRTAVTLRASLGTLSTLAEVSDDIVHGRVDMGKSLMGNALIPFFITLSISNRKIRDLVTVTTKTFFRYHKLRALIKSIRQYYSDVKIIVADDNEHPEKIDDENVEQYIMPFAKGWFAGRNLAISQVTTKYYLWVDDDFLFTEDTKIEKMVDVLERSDLDIVGGTVKKNQYRFKIIYEQGEDGGCMHLRYGSYRLLEGFPNCEVASGVVNFFLAHTDESRRVSFDPKLQRVAHSEFFMDGMHSLRVGSCSGFSVDHQSRDRPSDSQLAEAEKNYWKFRPNTQQQIRFKLALHYFKNRLKCYTKR